jgi:hypothetical protein
MKTLLASVALACAAAACSDETSSAPIADCELQTDGTMICPRSFPGCQLAPDVAVQFLHCGHRYEYTVYGRVESCPEIYYYPEGCFLSRADWEAFVGPCDARAAVDK